MNDKPGKQGTSKNYKQSFKGEVSGQLKTHHWPFKILPWKEKRQIGQSPSKHKAHMWWPRCG